MKKRLSLGQRTFLFFLTVFLVSKIPGFLTELKMTQALRSFDAQETVFTLRSWAPLPWVELRSDQLTESELELIQQYVDSYRFEKTVFLAEFNTDGGPALRLEFDCAQGHMALEAGRVYWIGALGIPRAALFEEDNEKYQAIKSLMIKYSKTS